MKIHLLTLLCCLLSTAFLYADNEDGQGTITGKVTTSDGLPAASVTVTLKGTRRSILTNDNGNFIIRNVPAGNYRLEVSLVGHETVTKEIVVEDQQATTIAIQLSLSNKDLQEVVVRSNPVKKITDKESDYVSRLPLKNIENPQAYSIVSKELMQQQINVAPQDALKNATGAAVTIYPNGFLYITSRGFLTAPNARNGMQTVGDARSSSDIGNVERYELIKGPSGTLFGASISSFGGVLNIVTKKPYVGFGGQVSYTTGSFGLNRIAADVNTPVNKDTTALLRINAVANQQNSFLNFGHNNTMLVAPSFSYKASERLSFLVDAEYYSVDQVRPMNYFLFDPSYKITSYDQIKIPYKKTLYGEDASVLVSSNKIFAQARYKLSTMWESTTLFSYTNEYVKQAYQAYPTILNDSMVVRGVVKYPNSRNTATNIQQNFNGTIFTGSIKHRILIGASYVNYMTSEGSRFINVDTVNINQDYALVNKAQVDQLTAQGFNYYSGTQQFFGVYASDVISIEDRLHLLLSLRWDKYNYKDQNPENNYDQAAVAPKLGLVYEILPKKLSLYGNYMTGFQNNGPVTQPNGSLFVPKPIYANQYEGGIKMEVSQKVNATLSYYYTHIDNNVRYDANNVALQDGKQTSKGVEVDIIANPIVDLFIVAGYAYNKSVIVRADEGSDIVGHNPGQAPVNVANLWISYKFQKVLRNFGIGIGANYVDKVYINSANDFYSPHYTLLNASVFYDQAKWRFGVKLNNITNQKSWGFSGNTNPLFNYAANLTFKF